MIDRNKNWLIESAREGVTIAIPNWNHEFLLPRSISSAIDCLKSLNHHGVPGEVLVVDDGSRDGSLTLLRQLEALHYDDGLRVCAVAKNGGLGAARNHALQQARFRYIAFLDADNELVAENLFQFYRSIKQTESVAVFGNLICLGGKQMRLLSNQSFQLCIFNGNYIDACALFDRVQIMDSRGYQTEQLLHGHDDWELYLHLAALGRRIVFVPMAFGIYYDLP
ncbi:MAG: glycosyltransferase family 2 protein, partial [Acidobacteriota bacterium]